MDVCQIDILVVLQECNDMKILLLLVRTWVLGNEIKGLFIVYIEVVTDGDLQRISVWTVLCFRVAETTDSLVACRSSSSFLDVCGILMQSRCRFCPIGGPLCYSSGLNCGSLKRKSLQEWRWFTRGSVVGNGVRPGCTFWCLMIWGQDEGMCLGVIGFQS